MSMRACQLSASLATVLMLAASARAEDQIVTGPGFEKGQRSERALTYVVPDGWAQDQAAANDAGIQAVLLPKGKRLSTTSAAITVAFQRKNAERPGLSTLEAFFRVDMQNMLEMVPALEVARWQPKRLDPSRVPYMSIEMWGKGTSPARVLFLDAGDGFYSVTLTVSTREALGRPEFESFFDSLALAPLADPLPR
jgi:hypothetical protein